MGILQDLTGWISRQIPAGPWHDKVYSYCERGSDAAFWAEPANALSNGAFFVAAFCALLLWVRVGRWRMVELALIVLVFVIGAGSFLFHTSATRWAEIVDVVPITAFMLAYVGYTLRRFMGFSWIATLLGVGLFYVLAYQAAEMRCEGVRCLNGSAGYVPALAVLLGAGIALLVMRRPVGASLIAGGIIFAVSLTFRTFDNAWCGAVMGFDGGPLGMHFLWHCFNAVLLFVLLRAAVHHGSVYSVR